MPTRRTSSLCRAASALALVLVLAGCTKGGQFDPTEVFNSDAFDSKKKLKGEREAVFPDGVPGTATGVPADLVKGYQPPPDQPDVAAAPAPAPGATAQAKPKPKPKPKVALQKPPQSTPTRINIAPGAQPGAAQQSQAPWPSPSQAASGQTAQPSQSVWPSTTPTAPPQQTAQPSQSIWPNPPAPGTTSQ